MKPENNANQNLPTEVEVPSSIGSKGNLENLRMRAFTQLIRPLSEFIDREDMANLAGTSHDFGLR